MPIVVAAVDFGKVMGGLYLALFGATLGGSIPYYCKKHHCGAGTKRDLETVFMDESAPSLLSFTRRQEIGPCNVPRYNYAQCNSQVLAQSTRINSSIPAVGVAQFDNIPPACMDLAVVMSGSCNGAASGKSPSPCGSACMRYTGLTDEEF